MLNEVKSRLISGKTIILFSFLFLISYNAYSQDITNTLGTDGEFTVKDGETTYLTLRSSDGLFNIKKNIRLENIFGSEVGIIYKGSSRFLHNYQPGAVYGKNTFLGINAGNFSMTGGNILYSSYNTGIGYASLTSITTAYRNTAVGYASLYTNTYGHSNTSVGCFSLFKNTSGYENTAIGYNSLYSNTYGQENTAIGCNSLYSNTIGYDNIAIGNNSLYSNTYGY